MAPVPAPLPVVLPLQGDPTALLSAVGALVDAWPADVDAELVVPSPALTARDRTVLAALGDEVRLVESAEPGFGHLAAAAATAVGRPVLVLDPACLPDAEALRALSCGAAAEGGVLLDPAVLPSAPVLTAAVDLPGLHALLGSLQPLADEDVGEAAGVRVPTLDPGVSGRPGVVSVVVAVHGPLARTRACVEALRRSTRRPYELVVVHRGCTDGTGAWLAAQRDLVVVDAAASTVPAAWNRGLAASTGEVVVLLDDGTVVPRFWAEGLLRALDADPRAAATGPRGAALAGAQRADGAAPGGPRAAADAWRRQHAGQTTPAPRLAGSCLAVRRSALLEVGGLDEGYGTASLADDDLCLRLRRAGWSLRVADEVLVHGPGAAPADDAAYRHHRAKWGASLGEDVLMSAALIVKDEQQALPRCLAALRGVVDEVVVCDTGSTDRTVEVAEAFGARVVHAPWTGHFAAARNAVLAHCRGSWVLSVDADEQLHLAPGSDLRRQLLGVEADALAVTVRSRSEEQGAASFEHEAGRLFRRGALTWAGAVHETLHDVRTGRPPVYLPATGLWLEHDGYVGRVYEARDKATRNLLLAEKDHAQATPERRWKTAYELARALSRDTGDDARVEELLRQALALMPERVGHLRCDAHVRLATVLARAGRLHEAEAAARDALRTAPADASARLVLGQVLATAGRLPEALAVVDAPQADSADAVRDLGKRDVDLPLLRARLLVRLDRGQEAEAELRAVAADHLDALDWPLLHEVASVDVVASLAARSPEAALAALDGLAGPDRATLHAALGRLGVDAQAHTPAALQAARLGEVLAGHDPEAVAQAALALEDTDLASALALWERLPRTPATSAARARCLLQLGRADDAVGAVEGLDPGQLEPADLLVVVAVAASAGDRGTAQLLLDTRADLRGQLPPEVRETLPGLVTTLGLALPGRVDHEQVPR